MLVLWGVLPSAEFSDMGPCHRQPLLLLLLLLLLLYASHAFDALSLQAVQCNALHTIPSASLASLACSRRWEARKSSGCCCLATAAGALCGH